MIILLSPAKKMKLDTDSLPIEGTPPFPDKTRQILSYLRKLSPEQLKKLWGCSESIAAQNIGRLQSMDFSQALTPAVLSYDGIAFQHMAPAVFDDSQFEYIQKHLIILSGFYGALKPLDGVCPYRLEMQAKASINGCKDLYEFWGRTIYDHIHSTDGVFLNLASKEYSAVVEKYLSSGDIWINCIFCENVEGKLVQRSTFAKMARGEMVRFLAENQIEDPAEMKYFNRLGFSFRPELSNETEYVFERIPDQIKRKKICF